LAITMGDPAGIGPEVTVRALAGLDENLLQDVIVVGEALWLQQVAEKIGVLAGGLSFREISESEVLEGRNVETRVVAVCNPLPDSLPQLEKGSDYAVFGDASFNYVKYGVGLVMRGICRALATAPISKRAWHLAGHNYPGHTELLRELSGSQKVGMMFWGERLKVLLATTHLPLAQVPKVLTVELLCEQIGMLYDFMQRVGITGDIGLAALNPHAGEQGAFGDEEAVILQPALAILQKQGIPVVGPVPADVLFYQALNGRYGALVALYHDQGLVPFKMLYFNDGVNLSLGLPFIRTSADHGTAFDISGKFIADSSSMEAAIALALKLSSD
ncbi:MAG TPA: 4-hydroxythreonine-4-phosphate dehydrogenase PdxA, partial [Desulfarculaceae bacterium]|nr:4-hydroxythreonine-4-phosphate dehydrogenase PdxA [Desulfarculaceae bacterium]